MTNLVEMSSASVDLLTKLLKMVVFISFDLLDWLDYLVFELVCKHLVSKSHYENENQPKDILL